VPERPDTQPGEPREAPDRQQVVIHARIVDPRVGRESRAVANRAGPDRGATTRVLAEVAFIATHLPTGVVIHRPGMPSRGVTAPARTI
jgi:hypothetical protein